MSAQPQNRDIIVIGTSAGGLSALKRLVKALPGDLPASVFIVLHVAPTSPGLIQQILARSTELPVSSPADGASIEPGRIYVAPPDHHLMLEPNRMRVVRGAKENRHRPAIDPLFRSAALHYGPRVIGVILTGMLDDGTLGLWEVKDRGGVAIVQDPADAEFPDMPANASRGVEVDHRVSLDEMPALLDRLAREPAPARSERAPSLKLRKEVESIMQDQNFAEMDRMGTPTVLTCPSCHGALWELHNGKLVSYRCHVGHAFTPASLDEEQSEELEKALTAALRALKERAETTRRVAQRLEGYGPSEAYLERIEDYEKAAEVLRRLLYERPGGQGP